MTLLHVQIHWHTSAPARLYLGILVKAALVFAIGTGWHGSAATAAEPRDIAQIRAAIEALPACQGGPFRGSTTPPGPPSLLDPTSPASVCRATPTKFLADPHRAMQLGRALEASSGRRGPQALDASQCQRSVDSTALNPLYLFTGTQTTSSGFDSIYRFL